MIDKKCAVEAKSLRGPNMEVRKERNPIPETLMVPTLLPSAGATGEKEGDRAASLREVFAARELPTLKVR
jgi:hypothetical protein